MTAYSKKLFRVRWTLFTTSLCFWAQKGKNWTNYTFFDRTLITHHLAFEVNLKDFPSIHYNVFAGSFLTNGVQLADQWHVKQKDVRVPTVPCFVGQLVVRDDFPCINSTYVDLLYFNLLKNCPRKNEFWSTKKAHLSWMIVYNCISFVFQPKN